MKKTKQAADTPQESAPVAVNPDYLPIRYIGKRPQHIDGNYGTRIEWVIGETKPVPVLAATRMLAHRDVYELGDPITEDLPPPDIEGKDKQEEEDRAHDVRQSISVMDKAGVVSFVKTNFSVDLDKRQPVDALRAHATQLFDQYGI